MTLITNMKINKQEASMFYRSQKNCIYRDLLCAVHSFQNAGEGRNGAPRSVDACGAKKMAKAMKINIYFALSHHH